MGKENWYVAPQVEVIEVEVERGFGGSGSGGFEEGGYEEGGSGGF